MDRSETAAAAAAVGRGGVPPEFPAGLRVLVVDDDATCLRIIGKMLKNCLYDVTTCSRAVAALSILRERKGGFDIVLSDVDMPDMDGFKLLELIGLEMDLPVIMMSGEDRQDVVLKGVTHGAYDYLIKPIRMEAVKTIWQHVVRKKMNQSRDHEQSVSDDNGGRQRKSSEDGENGSSATDGNWKHSKRKKEEEGDEGEEREDTSAMKKPRVVWTIELHQQFVAAVNHLGVDKAVPKKILELMNNPVLTRENVASHLQKYRLYLRRVSGGSQRQGRVDTLFGGSSENSFGLITSSDGSRLPALSVSSHCSPPQNLSTLQAGPRTFTNASIRSDQMSFHNFEMATMPSKVKPVAGQQLIVGQMNVLNGLPSSMNSQLLSPTIGLQQLPHSPQMMIPCGNVGLQVNAGKNIADLPTSIKICSPYQADTTQCPVNNPLLMPPASQMHNIPIDLHQKNTRSSVQQHPQPISAMLEEAVPSSMLSAIITQQNEVVSSPLISSEGVHMNNVSIICSASPSPYAGHRSNSMVELSGNCYPVGNIVGAPSLAPADMFQNSMQTRGSLDQQNSARSYAILHETEKNDPNWKLHNMNYNHLSSIQTGVNFGAPEFTVAPHAVQNRNFYAHSQDITMQRAEDKQLQRSCPGEPVNTPQLVDNSFKIKTESLPISGYGNFQIADGFYANELMKAVTEKQEMVGFGEDELNVERHFG